MANQKANWRQICINVLHNGPKDPSEYETAAALISDGYAAGDFRKNYRGTGGPIADVIWDGPTLKGREYADQLQDKLEKESTAYKLKIRFWNAMSFGTGCLFTAAVQNLF